ELLLQVLPVGDDDDLEAPELRDAPHLPDEEDHRQALSRALRVPDDPAAPVALAVLAPRLAVQQPVNGELHRPELLVAADDLHRLAAHRLKEREVPDDVEQVARPKHAGDELVLARELLLADLGLHLPERDRRRVLPLEVIA